MAILTEGVRFGAGHTGYLARPERARAPLPAIVVIQEAFGVDAHIEDVTRRFAGAGYVALAPDLFAVDGKRPEALSRERIAEVKAFTDVMGPTGFGDAAAREAALATVPADEAARLRESFAAIAGLLGKLAAFVPPLVEATTYLRDECEHSRGAKVGAVGFCMGGGLAALLACHDAQLGAAVIFYGMAPPVEKIASVQCPVLGLYGAHDPRIVGGIPGFTQAMRDAGKRYEPVVYEGAGHAFFNDGRPSYDARAARDALVRTLTLFRTTLD